MRRLACCQTIFDNVNPEYKNDKDEVKISASQKTFPIVLKINDNEKKFFSINGEVRIQGSLNPEDIVGVAFVPENRGEPLVFLSPKEFLEQFQKKKEKDKKTSKDDEIAMRKVRFQMFMKGR